MGDMQRKKRKFREAFRRDGEPVPSMRRAVDLFMRAIAMARAGVILDEATPIDPAWFDAPPAKTFDNRITAP